MVEEEYIQVFKMVTLTIDSWFRKYIIVVVKSQNYLLKQLKRTSVFIKQLVITQPSIMFPSHFHLHVMALWWNWLDVTDEDTLMKSQLDNSYDIHDVMWFKDVYWYPNKQKTFINYVMSFVIYHNIVQALRSRCNIL